MVWILSSNNQFNSITLELGFGIMYKNTSQKPARASNYVIRSWWWWSTLTDADVPDTLINSWLDFILVNEASQCPCPRLRVELVADHHRVGSVMANRVWSWRVHSVIFIHRVASRSTRPRKCVEFYSGGSRRQSRIHDHNSASFLLRILKIILSRVFTLWQANVPDVGSWALDSSRRFSVFTTMLTK